MATKSGGKSKVAQAASYKLNKRWESNRLRRLARTLQEQPNNEQVKAAMKGMVYRRKTPTTREWSASWISVAKIIKMFTGRFDRDIMSSNPEVARTALQRPGPKSSTPVKYNASEKSFFSLDTRNNLRKTN